MKTVAEILEKDAAWLAGRRGTLGGSDANILMSGDEMKIDWLWREKRGEVEPEDLSRVLPVQMGVWTEPFNVHWFEQESGSQVTHCGETRQHATYGFMTCTLDGLTRTKNQNVAVFEAKHVNQFSKMDEVAQKYMPQLHHNMACLNVRHAILSVFIGTMKYEFIEVECDDWYLAQLIDREKAFWACVESGEPPVNMEPVEAPAAPETLRSVDMDGNNEWASCAADWLAHGDAAKKFKKADKDIKALIDEDVGRAYGHGIEVKRASNGNLRILALKETK